MKRFFTLLATMATAVALQAAPISSGTLTLGGFQHGSAPTGKVTINEPGLLGLETSKTIGVSGINGSYDDGSSFGPVNFLLWCIEPMVDAVSGTVYDFNAPGLNIFNNAFSATQQTRLQNLFSKQFDVHGLNFADDVQTSAAVQLSVWEILYDNTTGFGDLSGVPFLETVLGIDTNGFWANTALLAARTEAEAILAGIDNYVGASGNTFNISSFNHTDGIKPGSQDFITVDIDFGGGCQGTPDCDPNNVPEPTPLALAGLGLLALGVASKRKKA